MIHNNGVYGQNEVPPNINSSLNVPQMNSPVAGLNNLSKYLETGESSSSYQHQYNNYSHPTLNASQFLPYHPNPFNFVPTGHPIQNFYSNDIGEIPNTSINFNINNTHYAPNKQFSKKNNIDLSNFYYRKAPQLQNESIEKEEDTIANESKSDVNINNLKTENLSNSKINNNDHRKIRKRKKEKTVNKNINESNKINTLVENNDAVIEQKELSVEKNNDTNIEKDNDSELLNLSSIKLEETSQNDKEDGLDSNVNPFLKDIHGINSEDLELVDYNIVGLDEAKKIIDGEIEFDFGTMAFNCDLCSLIFLHPKRYLIHCKWHNFGRLKQKYTRKKEIKPRPKKEIKLENVPEDLYCKECNRTFITTNGMNSHIDRYHTNSPKECNICQKTFKSYTILIIHKRKMHANITSYNCPICPKTFKFPKSLQKHQDTHLEKIHGCTECDKKFGSQLLLSIHIKTHERSMKERTFRCSYCGKGYYDSHAVACHERSHTNERPFECDICHTTFSTSSGVKRHKKVSHSTNKPFECPICHRSFTTALIRDRHQVRYHNSPELLVYPCKHCPNRFMSEKELNKHCKMDHNTGRVRRKRKVESNDSE